jgi:hypothetical protein
VVIFFRPALNSGSTFYLFTENGRNIGGLRSGNYFAVKMKPGAHIIRTLAPSDLSEIEVQVKANETTYVLVANALGKRQGFNGYICAMPHLSISSVVFTK